MLKKLGIGSYLNMAASVFGVVAIVAMILSNTNDNPLPSLTMCIVASVVAIALCAVGIVLAPKSDLLRSVSGLGAIALFVTALGLMIIDRVMLIAGLYSFNSSNDAGWQVFNITVVAAIGLVFACVSVIAGAFTKATK